MPRAHVTSRRSRVRKGLRCPGTSVCLTTASGRVEVAICRCCGEIVVSVDGAEIYARPGPLTADAFRASCRYAAHLVSRRDAAAAAELVELGA